MAPVKIQQIAVVGAGIAGASCARALTLAGHAVHLFDKSRGPGGRLATRRVARIGRQGQTCTTSLDHGAVGFTARAASFQAFVDQALRDGGLAEWAPTLAAGGSAVQGAERFYVPVPDMPSLCRRQLAGVATSWSFAVDALVKGEHGWQVQAGSVVHPQPLDAVVLALPPAQAAALLCQHRRDWARHASIAPMQPCWTLMGVDHTSEDAAEPAPAWGLARPATGPLDWVLRNDARPGRVRVPGQAHGVVHARAGWSRRHLEQPAAWVQQQLQAALAQYLGRPVAWHHCAVHRWRYALPQAHKATASEPFWWDAALGLGVCGDFLGGSGRAGVEAAWLSAQALALASSSASALSKATLRRTSGAAHASPSPAAHGAALQPVRRLAA